MSGNAAATSTTTIVPYHGSDLARQAIIGSFQVVATNVQALAIDAFLSEARVIFLGERHLIESDRASIAKVVNGFDSTQVRLLLEGNIQSQSDIIFPEIADRNLLAKAKTWDSGVAIDSYSNFVLEQKLPLLYDGLHLLTFLSQALNGRQIDPAALGFLLQFDSSIEAIGGKYQITIETFKRAASSWLKNCQEVIESEYRLVDDAFIKRNNFMAQTVKEAVAVGIRKIIVIAGSAHLTPSEKHQASVKFLHKTMLESMIPFVILDQKSANEEVGNSSLANFFQKAKQVAPKFNGRIYPPKEIDSLINELEPKYQAGKAFSVSELSHDIFKLVMPISTLDLAKST